MEDHNLNLLSKLGTFYPGKHGRTLQFLYTLHTTLSCHMAVHRASSRVPPGRNIASAQPSQDWSCGLVGGSLQLQGTLPSCVPVPCVSGGRPGETGEVGREDGSHGTESRLAPNHVLNVFLYIYIYSNGFRKNHRESHRV